MRLHIDVSGKKMVEGYAVEVKVGNDNTHKTFEFKHEAIIFNPMWAAIRFVELLNKIDWKGSKSILIADSGLPFSSIIVLKTYGMKYLYKTEYVVRKINLSYTPLTEAEIRQGYIDLALKDLNP